MSTAALPAAAARPVREVARRYAVCAVRVLLLVAGLTVLGLALGTEAQAAERPGAEKLLERVVANEPMDRADDTGLEASRPDGTELDGGGLDGTSMARQETPRQPVDLESSVGSEPSADSVEPSRSTAGRDGAAVATRAGAAAVGTAVKRAVTPVALRVVEPVAEAEPFREAVTTTTRTAGRLMAGRTCPVAVGDGLGGGQFVPVAVTVPVATVVPVPGRSPVSAGSAAEGQLVAPAPAPAPEFSDMAPRTAPPGPPAQYLADAFLGRGGSLPTAPGRAPGAPGGPGGSAVLQVAGDGHPHRSGDPQGAWFSRGAAFVLMRGSRQPADGAGLRECHRDILEFPG
ncbi:hypothetical protein V1460_32550 [Streptomyces sp. SCSIO 30461]|uniref:hypothetical protein n=1 Tax=Streptomyces sp. SCSIO 30461 TaxID=3118085 RepID=UPI0030D1AE6C